MLHSTKQDLDLKLHHLQKGFMRPLDPVLRRILAADRRSMKTDVRSLDAMIQSVIQKVSREMKKILD